MARLVNVGAEQVLDILKTLRIGSLSLEDMAENQSNADKNSDDPYAKVSLAADALLE